MLGFGRHDAGLAFNLFKMNIRDRYLGSSLGSFWAIANPLFMLALYTFVFGFVTKVRLPGSDSTLGYVIWLISGYGPWIATTEGLMAATTSVVGAAGLVKNITFKVELLPIAGAFVGLVSLAVSLCFLLVLLVVDGNAPGWRVVWLPVVVALHFFLIVSMGLWLSAVNVFKRDLAIALPNMLTIVMFVTPIFFPIESMPPIVQKLSLVNPFYLISNAYREVLVANVLPSQLAMLYLLVLSLLIFYSGLKIFRNAKGYFVSAM